MTRIDVPEDLTPETIDSVVSRVAALDDPGVLLLALGQTEGEQMVPALRRAGITAPIQAGDAMGSEQFLQRLAGQLQAGEDLDLVTDGFFASAPLIPDSLTGDAVRWLFSYLDVYGTAPGWRAATSYEAAIVLVHALRNGGLGLTDDSRDQDRIQLRDALAALDSPENSLHGIIAPLYFVGAGAMPTPLAVGQLFDGRFVTSANQLTPFNSDDEELTGSLIESGDVFAVRDNLYRHRRVVSVGIVFNELSELKTQDETFTADFFLYLSFTGDDDVTDLAFVNAVNPNLTLGEPIRSAEVEDGSYRLYRVKGAFKAPLNFRDFPFDTQNLTIEVRHATLSSEQVVYRGHTEILNMTQGQRLTSGANAAVSINAIPEWEARSVFYSLGTVSTSAALGDPTLSGGQTGISFSEFVTTVTIGRDVPAFLAKNLLPLILLAVATFVSLFYSHAQTAARVSFGITGILTGAVLLNNVTSSLPPIGYSVAIEWAYYAFILLSAALVAVALFGGRLQDRGETIVLRRIDLTTRIAFPAVILAIALAYYLIYR